VALPPKHRVPSGVDAMVGIFSGPLNLHPALGTSFSMSHSQMHKDIPFAEWASGLCATPVQRLIFLPRPDP
jgi:hypothetical protein